MQMASGAPFELGAGFGSPITIEDVAAGLCKVNRFCGATRVPYSVAQHSVHVSKLIRQHGGNWKTQLCGLLHDAHEAVIGDIPTPAKRLLVGAGAFEETVAHRVMNGLGVDTRSADHALIRMCDLIALSTEKRDLMAPEQQSWGEFPRPDARKVKPVGWRAARGRFLARYGWLAGE